MYHQKPDKIAYSCFFGNSEHSQLFDYELSCGIGLSVWVIYHAAKRVSASVGAEDANTWSDWIQLRIWASGVLRRPKLAENVPKKSRRYKKWIPWENLIRIHMLDARNTQSIDENEVFKVGQNPGCTAKTAQIGEKQKNSNLPISAASVNSNILCVS